jgi:hypothetical protein
MGYTPRTNWAELVHPDLFARYRQSREWSYEYFAERVQTELDKGRRGSAKWPELTCSGETLRKLEVGRTKRTRELMGVAIERALEVPRGALFAPRVAHVSRAMQYA